MNIVKAIHPKRNKSAGLLRPLARIGLGPPRPEDSTNHMLYDYSVGRYYFIYTNTAGQASVRVYDDATHAIIGDKEAITVDILHGLKSGAYAYIQ